MEYVGHFAALGTLLCWAVSVLTFEAAGRRVGSMAVNFIRLAMAWGMLAVWGLLSERHLALPTDATAEEWYWLSLSGLAGFFIGDLCLFRAFLMIGPRLSTLVFILATPMTAVLGILALGEELTWVNWLGMAVTLAGVAWVVTEGKVTASVKQWTPSVWGVTLAVLGALGQAVANVLSKKGLTGDYDAFAASQIRVTASLPAFLLLFVALRWHGRVWRGLRDGRAMAQMSLGALFGPVIGVSLLLVSFKHLAVGVAQTFTAALPVVILPFTMVVYKEKVTWRALIGALVAVAGVGLLFVK